MENNFVERLTRLYEELKTNQAGMAKLMGTSRTSLSNLQSGIAKLPSSEVAINLYNNSGISPNWLLMGIGNMYEKDNISDSFTIDFYQKQIQQMQKRIESLEFTEALFKREKMKEPEFANFTKPNTEKGRVVKFSGASRETGATCGVVANF